MQVAELLASEDIKLATAAAGILIHAAAPMLQSESSAGEGSGLAAKLKPLLLQLCSSGAPKAAKVAIRYCCSKAFAAGSDALPSQRHAAEEYIHVGVAASSLSCSVSICEVGE